MFSVSSPLVFVLIYQIEGKRCSNIVFHNYYRRGRNTTAKQRWRIFPKTMATQLSQCPSFARRTLGLVITLLPSLSVDRLRPAPPTKAPIFMYCRTK